MDALKVILHFLPFSYIFITLFEQNHYFFLGSGLLEIESECFWGLKHFLLVIDAGHSAQISHVLPALCSYVISERTIGSGTIYTAY